MQPKAAISRNFSHFKHLM